MQYELGMLLLRYYWSRYSIHPGDSDQMHFNQWLDPSEKSEGPIKS